MPIAVLPARANNQCPPALPVPLLILETFAVFSLVRSLHIPKSQQWLAISLVEAVSTFSAFSGTFPRLLFSCMLIKMEVERTKIVSKIQVCNYLAFD